MVFSLNNLFSLNNVPKKIHFYVFSESIKNQIQIIKINYILLDSLIDTNTHSLNKLFLCLGRFIIIIIIIIIN